MKTFLTFRFLIFVANYVMLSIIVVSLLDNTGQDLKNGVKYSYIPADVHLTFLNDEFNGNDTQLHQYIRSSIIGHSQAEYALQESSSKHSQASQDSIVDKLLHGKRYGFFVECGAADGERYSNTLFFERFRHWAGLLIEANPHSFRRLLSKNRKAYSINACLSLDKYPKKMDFFLAGLLGGLNEGFDSTHKNLVHFSKNSSKTTKVQCFPFVHIMAAMGRDHIDYFSLDVEGPEVAILRAIPFNELRIDVLSVEYQVWDGRTGNIEAKLNKLKAIREIMTSTGLYAEHGIAISDLRQHANGKPEELGLDVIFKRKDIEI